MPEFTIVDVLLQVFREAGDFLDEHVYVEVCFQEGRTAPSIGIFCPKPDVVTRVLADHRLAGFASVCGTPLFPNPTLLKRVFAAGFPKHLFFLGDLSPLDFALFLVLQELTAVEVHFLGISDRLLSRGAVVGDELVDFSKLERQLFHVLNKNVPREKLVELIGEYSLGLMCQRKRLELVVAARPSVPASDVFLDRVFDSICEKLDL